MLRVNSKEVMQGDTFLALSGIDDDGHNHIEEAIDKGASCVIVQEGEYSVKTITTKDTRSYLARYLSELYAEKIKKISLIGVLGTRGKTTTAYLIYNLLNSLNKKCAYIGSKGFYIDEKVKNLNNITPDLYELYELINSAASAGCEYLVLEVTNHSLVQRRLDGLNFKYAVLTNIGKDSYKADLEDYINVELKLFESLKRSDYAIINGDDKYYDKFLNIKSNIILYGKKGTDYKISSVKLLENHSTFNLSVSGNKYEIDLPFPCDYNIYNYVCAFIIANKIGIKPEDIVLSTSYLNLPKDIYQVFEKDGKKVIVDNASLPSEVKNVINYAKKYAKGKILTVIGTKGTTDKEFRKLLGKTVLNGSDYVIFTNDNPYKEDFMDIINDMITSDNYEVVLDRKEAIKKGISLMESNDTLLVLGRGEDETQIIGSDNFPVNDINEVSKYMK